MKVSGRKLVPAAVAVLGIAALVLRLVLNMVAVDEKGLLVAGHPLVAALAALTAAALLVALVFGKKLEGSAAYADNFTASIPAMVGHFAAAAGIAVTVLTRQPMMPGYLGQGWKLLGYLAPVCLVLAGVSRGRGKRPFFGFHLIPCLFLVFHLVNHYRSWSGEPQILDYGFTFFGTMALTLFAFYSCCFDAEAGNRGMQLFSGLAAGFLLLAELAETAYFSLYLGGILWAFGDLCTLYPKPKPQPEPEQKEAPQEGA
ncbi:MAG: hypothetical protein IKJ84_05420 [Oscillospiraceae bacterium]|nr:hypothetical protein [Oscillospiraceae bacterium]